MKEVKTTAIIRIFKIKFKMLQKKVFNMSKVRMSTSVELLKLQLVFSYASLERE